MITTSTKQSKKLLKLGVNANTSDMFYWCGASLRIGGINAQDEELDIPAWSLQALLNSQPYLIELIKSARNMYRCDVDNMRSKWHRNPIDAVMEIIERKGKV